MIRTAFVATLTSGLLLGCAPAAVGRMWMASYEINKNSEWVNLPTENDPVRDGRLYRNVHGVTLQFADGHLRIEGPDCMRLRAKLVLTDSVRMGGPDYPYYGFAVVERTALATRCEAALKTLDSFGMAPHSWEVDGKPDPRVWMLDISSSTMRLEGFGSFDYLDFSDKKATIEDPR